MSADENKPRLTEFAQKVVLESERPRETPLDNTPEEMFSYLQTRSENDEYKNNFISEIFDGYVVDLEGQKHTFTAEIHAIHEEDHGETRLLFNRDYDVNPLEKQDFHEVKFTHEFVLPNGVNANTLLDEFLNHPDYEDRVTIESTGKEVNPRDVATRWIQGVENWVADEKLKFISEHLIDHVSIKDNPAILPVASSHDEHLYACLFEGNMTLTTGEKSEFQAILYALDDPDGNGIQLVDNDKNHQKVTVTLCEEFDENRPFGDIDNVDVLNTFFKNPHLVENKLTNENHHTMTLEVFYEHTETICEEFVSRQKKSEREQELDEIQDLLTARCGKSMANEIMAGANRDVDEQSSTQIRHSQRAVRHH